jgi:hypothetical protein
MEKRKKLLLRSIWIILLIVIPIWSSFPDWVFKHDVMFLGFGLLNIFGAYLVFRLEKLKKQTYNQVDN